jgi:hypothetical protein
MNGKVYKKLKSCRVSQEMDLQKLNFAGRAGSLRLWD